MNEEIDKNSTFLVFAQTEQKSMKEILEALEKGTDSQKLETLRRIILLQQQGDVLPQKLMMTIIRYVLPSENKLIKKHLLYYWETVGKRNKEGKLLQEFLLVCNFLRKDLTHPNEYIRGITLRFLCKVKEREIFEPLIKPIVQNLTSRHSYVRRNAVLAIYSIYQNFEDLIPDAPEIIETFLTTETDVSSKRNAFVMLVNCDQDRAVRYVRNNMDRISQSGDLFQLSLLNLLRKMCKTNPQEKGKYLKVISSLLDSKTPSVLYQCAVTLISLSASPIAIRAAANCFTQLLLSNVENNVKLIVLDRIVDLRQRYPDLMQQMIMDILRGLNCPSMDVKRKVLEISSDLVSRRNVEDILGVFKKELLKQDNSIDPKLMADYKNSLVLAIHECTIKKFPEMAAKALFVIDFIGSEYGASVALFAREIIEVNNNNLRNVILSSLCASLATIKSQKVFRDVFWILGAYAEQEEDISLCFDTIKQQLTEGGNYACNKLQTGESGSTTLGNGTVKGINVESNAVGDVKVMNTTQPKLRSDGTYATEMVSITDTVKVEEKPMTLIRFIENGNSYLISVIASTLTKLALKMHNIREKSSMPAEAILLMCGLVNHHQPHQKFQFEMDEGVFEKVGSMIQLLLHGDDFTLNLLLKEPNKLFTEILQKRQEKFKKQQDDQIIEKVKNSQVDAFLTITQLKGRKIDAFEFEEDVLLATKATNGDSATGSGKLKVTQLTGFSDPVYAEATISIRQFDILLNVLVVNQTNDTLQNLTLELSTIGDLRLCERPQSYTMAPHKSMNIIANLKVSSTESSLIFGNLVYDLTGTAGKCIILNEIRIDIMDYIHHSVCDISKFRAMWSEFDWENKITIDTLENDLKKYLQFIADTVNMEVLTPEEALEGDCEFLSANLYAKSSFGEDALANLSIELRDNKINGFFRIRSKCQGIAAALGERIHKIQLATAAK